MSLPNERFKLSENIDLDRKLPSINRRTRLFSETHVDTLKLGLNVASESINGNLPGIMHKHQIQHDLLLKNFVTRMPARCACCGKESKVYCPSCVWKTFFADQNFAAKRDEYNMKKAKSGTKLKNILEQEGNDQSQLFKKKRRIEELKMLIHEKRVNITKLEENYKKKLIDVEKIQKNVDTLKKKADVHSKRIQDNKIYEDKLKRDLELLKTRRNNLIFKHFNELVTLFPIIESAPQRNVDGESTSKIIQLIEDAAFGDKKRYSEVAKKTIPKIYFKVRQCFVPGNNDYSELLNEIDDLRTLKSKASKETIAGLAFTAQFINAASYLFDVYTPYRTFIDDLLQCENWTKQLFLTDVFCLNLSIVLLCLHSGINSKYLNINQPFNNLNILKQKLLSKNLPLTISFFDVKHDKLHDQILTTLNSLSWEESQETGFDTDEIEEEWVSVTKTRT